MALAKINGKLKHFNCESIKIAPVSNGRWSVAYDGGNDFLVIGGVHSGGARNEWFCYHPKFYGENWLPCKSMVAAIKLGVQY